MRATNGPMFRELVIGLGALVAAVLGVALIVWVNIGLLERAGAADREVREELAQDSAVIEAMIDQETGLRGYVISGNLRFLQPYHSGRNRLDAALRRRSVLAADDPPEVRWRVAEVARLANSWTATVAAPAITALQNGLPAELPILAGRVQMDGIRQQIAALRNAELRTLVQRDANQAQAFRSSRLALIFGSAVALAFAMVIGGRSFWRLIAAQKAAAADAARLADALERAHAAERAKTLFLSNMSHEMRTPLNGVSGMAEVLQRTNLDPAQRGVVEVIQSSAAALDRLIGDLLTLAREGRAGERPQALGAFHLGDVVRTACAGQQAAADLKGLALRLDIGPEADATVFGDAAVLDQLLNCLLSNAVKFTDRGQVRLMVGRDVADGYRFEVADTGIGFDEARKAELFETFAQSDATATRRHGGAGLGLALARQLAADLGGRLECRSTPGQGSVFTFEARLSEVGETKGVSKSTQAARPAADVAGDAPLRILVVDDNATNRRVLELILEQLGVETTSVEDGRQAVDAASRQAFAAILMDIQMPVMDGLAATREIRRLEREVGRAPVPIIIVSANGQPEHIQAGHAAGAQMYLTKPVAAQALADALNATLADTAQAA